MWYLVSMLKLDHHQCSLCHYTPLALAMAVRQAGAVEVALEEEFREATCEALLQEIAHLWHENHELHNHLLQFMDGTHSDDDHPAHHHSEN
jgi:hypothetical protein